MLEIICPAAGKFDSIELAKSFSPRQITHVFHDIDGTHSLIRDWVPVMALVNGAVARYGMFPGNAREVAEAIGRHRNEEFEEARRFAIESAGLSALTQMEWALRMARRLNNTSSEINEEFEEARRFAIESAGLSALTQMEWALRMARRLNNTSSEINEKIIAAIWQGAERFEDSGESAAELALMNKQASELFRAYEILLLEMCRNENLADAKLHPEKWQVPGSMDFIQFLFDNGVKNYFVTGAVVEYDSQGNATGTMAEEVITLGYPIGEGKLIEQFCGSVWNKKEPKVEIMRKLCRNNNIAPENLLIVGDGRSEIAAAVELGALAISRLDNKSLRQKEIHRTIGTNLIVNDYRQIKNIFRR